MRRGYLNTTSDHDARLCGYDRPVHPHEHDEGLIIEAEDGSFPSIHMTGALGSLELVGRAEIQATIKALTDALASFGPKSPVTPVVFDIMRAVG